ncbi:hypothetical protein HMPREF0670_01692 [Prevotella sp. oral taxon 317 str. F0108]|nr:hypothetical protein HMPREF0670_01692 [Prevotella sp. oral taxon 317 str. F0108]
MQAKTTVENLTVKDAMGDYVGRFANCYKRPTAPDGTKITPTPLDYNWLNNDLALALVVQQGCQLYIQEHQHNCSNLIRTLRWGCSTAL